MVLDIIAATIVVLSMVFGFRRGFIFTFTRTLGWLGAVIAGFFAAPLIRKFMTDKTGMYDSIYSSLKDRFGESTEGIMEAINGLPALISDDMSSAAEDTADALITNLTNLLMVLLCFVIAVLLIKLSIFILTLFFSKKENRGFIGFFDGLLGLIAGALKGIILVFIFLAVLLPAVNLFFPNQSDAVQASLETSTFAQALYDSNFIVMVINDFFR